MRTRLIALGLMSLCLAAPAAFADDRYDHDGGRDSQGDGWHRDWHPEGRERESWNDRRHEDRNDGWRDNERHEWREREEQRERYEAILQRECAIERDRERLEHELREGDWRAADELRQKIRWEERDLERFR